MKPVTQEEFMKVWFASDPTPPLIDIFFKSRYANHTTETPHPDLVKFDEWCAASFAKPFFFRPPIRRAGHDSTLMLALMDDEDCVKLKLFWPHILLKVERFDPSDPIRYEPRM